MIAALWIDSDILKEINFHNENKFSATDGLSMEYQAKLLTTAILSTHVSTYCYFQMMRKTTAITFIKNFSFSHQIGAAKGAKTRHSGDFKWVRFNFAGNKKHL